MTKRPKSPAKKAATPIVRAENPPPALAAAPSGYAEWLADVKARVHAAQQRATLAVNRELLAVY